MSTTVTCPVTGKQYMSQRQSSPKELIKPTQNVTSQKDSLGNTIWTLHSYQSVKQVLRAGYKTKQAGFSAESTAQMFSILKPTVLHQDGEEHKKQRTAIAKFFTPKAVKDNYQDFMTEFSQKIIDEISQKSTFDLGEFSMKLAARVAAQVIGLTSSSYDGMTARLNRLLNQKPAENFNRVELFFQNIKTQFTTLQFYLNDVLPAIRNRRKNMQDGEYKDVIEYLLQQDYNNLEITVECLTYGAAGMVTTKEFITMATWHMLKDSNLRRRYLQAEQKERHTILHEILRLEPVLMELSRRAVEDIMIEDGKEGYHIEKGDLIKIDIAGANADANAVGETPLNICPQRERQKRVQKPVLSFGDGPHRCPGAFIAIEESDIFLQKLLVLPLEIAEEPLVSWNKRISSYVIEGLKLRHN